MTQESTARKMNDDDKQPAVVEIEQVTLGVAKFSMTEQGIALIKEKYNPEEIMKGDLAEKETYELCTEAIRAYSKPRIRIGKERLSQTEAVRTHVAFVNEEGARITKELKEPEDKLKAWKKDFDTAKEIAKREKAQAEEKRIDDINTRIATIRAMAGSNISGSAADVKLSIDTLCSEQETFNQWAEEFSDKAKLAIEEAGQSLKDLFNMKVASENAEAEAERVKKEAEAKAEKERLEREAENKRVAAENKAAQDKLNEQRAEMKAQQDKIDAEKKALDDAKAEAEEAKKKAEADAKAKAEEARKDAEAEAKAEEAAKQRAEDEAKARALADKRKKEEEKKAKAAAKQLEAEKGKRVKETLTALEGIVTKAKAKAVLTAVIDGEIPWLSLK